MGLGHLDVDALLRHDEAIANILLVRTIAGIANEIMNVTAVVTGIVPVAQILGKPSIK